ncbi:MAG TPA: response regulator transcription factor [Vicinamibacteria bacterium]|nr:response regulator transcription factor [Vicinamibacteria bacterium]
MPRVLLVEDEDHLAQGIRFNLELDGYDVETIGDGLRAAERLAPAPDGPVGEAGPAIDLVVLDVMLPGLDGFQIVERMRQAGNYTPVLMLTAKGLPEDVVQGLEAGADDYLPKPFDLPVLLARVRGLIRRRDWTRAPAEGAALVRVGEVEADFANLELRKAEGTVQLTLLEAMLLKLLVERRGQVVTKAEILEKVWNLNPDTETRAVDNFVMRLRRHIERDTRNPRLLQTVRGVGYRLVEEGPPP